MEPMNDPRDAPVEHATHARRPRVFSGRVIFDHLQKTAGMAVNRWLRNALGDGCASPNMLSIDHRSLIARFGGVYSVLTAHVTFDRGGLDPRYQYVTLLREPIDRMVSWFHYVVNNYTDADVGEGWHDVKRFLESDGADCSERLTWNLYAGHFAAIEGVRSDHGRHLIDAAVAAVDRYDVWGLYEAMPEFLADFAGLLGVPAPTSLDRVNVTRQRPTMVDLRGPLRSRLADLNALDLEFYDIMKSRYAEKRRRWGRASVVASGWEPLHVLKAMTRASEEFTLHSARIIGDESRAGRSLVEFDVAFSLARPVADAEIGITVRDSTGSRVFSTSSTALGTPVGPVAAGSYRARFTFMANLPDGEYSVGLRVREKLPGRPRELAAFDGLAVFRIGSGKRALGPARFHLPTTIHCVRVDPASSMEGWRLGATDRSLHSHVGRVEGESIVSDGRAGFLLFGPYKTVIAGRWRAAVEGVLEPGEGCLRIDVASGSGRLVHASLDVADRIERAELEFRLENPVHDLEIRVWVHELASARIDAVAIESGRNGIPHEGEDDHGLPEGRIETVREAAAAADPAEAQGEAGGDGPSDGIERGDGAVARGDAAVGDPPGRAEAERLEQPDGDAAVANLRSAGLRIEGPGEPRADDARDPRASRGDRHGAGSSLTAQADPTFSIVIATDGRGSALAELLDSLPFLEGPPFEVCVVRGPTEDGVDAVLEAWRGRIKTAVNPLRNLSISRNIGIAMAAGEIVAFLDDDAIPDPDWLSELAGAFHDPGVACVGGLNRARSGERQQYGYATANRMGQARWDRTEPADALCVPGAAEFPYTQGTNTAIRRSDLEALGGFDEEYEFYLDETDLCCRLVDAGRRIRQLPRAFVHHRSLPSVIRTSDGVTHSLHAVLKNKLYFSLVNNRGHHTTDEAIDDFDTFVAVQERHLRKKAASSADGPRWLAGFAADAARARAIGFARGLSGLRRLMSPGLVERHRQPFLPLGRRSIAERQACKLHRPRNRVAVTTTTTASVADRLRSQREVLRRTWAEILPPGSRVALALYPDHRNVGDAAIWWGTRSLLESLRVTVGYGCDPWSYAPERLAAAVPFGPILLLGGGNFGDVYGGEQGLRARILRDFPDRPIVQLPQSIWFRATESRDEMAALLTRQRDATLFLRDTRSLAFARTHFPSPSMLCPDAAVALDLAGVPRRCDVPVVALWRRDIELDLPLPPLPQGSIEADWHDDLEDLPPWTWRTRGFRAAVGQRPPPDLPCPPVRLAAWRLMPSLWDSLARERVLRGCHLLARGRVVITNRLHAHLLCTLMDIPHVVCDTVNGKLSAYLETWESAGPTVYVASNPEEAVAVAESLAFDAPSVLLRAA